MSQLDLGAFSMSLAVKDLSSSRDFYQKLGFEPVGGDPEHGYLIVRNAEHTIGLFQGMFEANILTFNPGWDQAGNDIGQFTDVRQIRQTLLDRGIDVSAEPGNAQGPGSIMLTDPDGNQILIDQHR